MTWPEGVADRSVRTTARGARLHTNLGLAAPEPSKTMGATSQSRKVVGGLNDRKAADPRRTRDPRSTPTLQPDHQLESSQYSLPWPANLSPSPEAPRRAMPRHPRAPAHRVGHAPEGASVGRAIAEFLIHQATWVSNRCVHIGSGPWGAARAHAAEVLHGSQPHFSYTPSA